MPDQQPGFRFGVEISGIQEAVFSECSGFEVKVDVEEYKEGGFNDYVHKIPGRQSYSNLTLKRGMTNSIELWQWLDRVASKSAKKEEKKNISVVMFDGKGAEKLRWNLTGAFPIKWTSPTLQAGESSVMVESLELAYEEFTLLKR
jgi:phage tail-like protein